MTSSNHWSIARLALPRVLTVVVALAVSLAPGYLDAEPFGPVAAANPGLAATTGPTMHGDSTSTKAFPFDGPGPRVDVRRTPLAATCPTIVHGSDGYPVALCTSFLGRAPVAHLLNPDTGASLARLSLTAGDLLGGVYAFLDADDRLVMVDGSRDLLWIEHARDTQGNWFLAVSRRVPIGDVIPENDGVAALMPAYDGRIWFATSGGVIGVYDPISHSLRTGALPDGERVANSLSTAPGGVAIVSTHALYLFALDSDGSPVVIWRHVYERGQGRKPGQLSWGSGSTPVFFGPHTGTEYVTITDNANPHMRVLVLRADSGSVVCEVPVFTDLPASGTENANVASGRSVFVMNTYGYDYPVLPSDAGPSVPARAEFSGGIARLDVTADGNGCELRWSASLRSAGLPRLSMTERALYTVMQGDGRWLAWMPFWFARVDADTGRVLSRAYLGFGLANPLQMTGTVMPDGTLYQGTISGWLRIARR